MKGVIYCYHCISTGKKYIGQTIREGQRKTRHRIDCEKGIDNKFYRAVRKYGWENFIYAIIDEYDVDILNEKEIFYIDYYDSYNNGYNSTIGGGGVRGFISSVETRKKQSISAKNRTDTRNKKYFTEEEKKEAKRKADRKYQQKIKERRKEYMKEWRKNNKEKIDKWKEKNKEHLKETWKKHREKNKEKRNEYSRWYWHNVVKTKNKLSQEDCLD